MVDKPIPFPEDALELYRHDVLPLIEGLPLAYSRLVRVSPRVWQAFFEIGDETELAPTYITFVETTSPRIDVISFSRGTGCLEDEMVINFVVLPEY